MVDIKRHSYSLFKFKPNGPPLQPTASAQRSRRRQRSATHRHAATLPCIPITTHFCVYVFEHSNPTHIRGSLFIQQQPHKHTTAIQRATFDGIVHALTAEHIFYLCAHSPFRVICASLARARAFVGFCVVVAVAVAVFVVPLLSLFFCVYRVWRFIVYKVHDEYSVYF